MPTIRGTGQQASSASSYTVSWPSGTVAGDFALIMTGHGFNTSVPSGWTANSPPTSATNWNGAVFSKILSGADISTGFVSVSFSGGFNGTIAIITFVGAGGVAGVNAAQNASGSASVNLSTSGYTPDPSYVMVYFGSNRAASTDTVSSGTLQRQANDGSAASGCLYTETGVSGAITRTFSYSVAGSGNYQAIAAIGPPPAYTASRFRTPAIAASAAQHQAVKGPLNPSAGGAGNPVPVAANLLGGFLGVPYSETIGAQGGTGPYTFAVTAGTLPAGTTMSSGGVISGTPTTIGSFSFTVTVTDSASATGSHAFTIGISSGTSGSNYGYTA